MYLHNEMGMKLMMGNLSEHIIACGILAIFFCSDIHEKNVVSKLQWKKTTL